MKKLLLILLTSVILTTAGITPAFAQAQTCLATGCPSGQACTQAGDGWACTQAAGGTPQTSLTVTPNPSSAPTGAQTASNCTPSGGNLCYVPLEPIPGLTTNSNLTNPRSLPAIINAIFAILITIGALIAVLSLTVGGIEYMVSVSAETKSTGIKRAQAALWGIVLLSGIWLILHTVNPYLLNFSLTPCPDGVNCAVTGSSLATQNTNTAAVSPIPGLSVDQQTCTNVKDSQTLSGNLLNQGAFWYSLNSVVKDTWSGLSVAEQTQRDQNYLAACAQNKFI